MPDTVYATFSGAVAKICTNVGEINKTFAIPIDPNCSGEVLLPFTCSSSQSPCDQIEFIRVDFDGLNPIQVELELVDQFGIAIDRGSFSDNSIPQYPGNCANIIDNSSMVRIEESEVCVDLTGFSLTLSSTLNEWIKREEKHVPPAPKAGDLTYPVIGKLPERPCKTIDICTGREPCPPECFPPFRRIPRKKEEKK